MERLTIKENDEYLFDDRDNEFYLASQKLGQLEDIEEKLGIDLITFVLALKNGIYCLEQPGDQIIYLEPYFVGMVNFGIWHYTSKTMDKRLKDYGKKWALTKEELEK